jgi:nucleoid DNA-binding protein
MQEEQGSADEPETRKDHMGKHVPTGRLNHLALIKAVAAESDVSQEVTARVLRAFFDVVPRNVVAGYPVNVTNFGTWYPKWCPTRAARNPQTGGTVMIPGRSRAMFRWSPSVQDAVAVPGILPETFKKKPSHH